MCLCVPKMQITHKDTLIGYFFVPKRYVCESYLPNHFLFINDKGLIMLSSKQKKSAVEYY